MGSPCAFGCTPNGANGFICGCPTGYQRIGQVIKILKKVNPFEENVSKFFNAILNRVIVFQR